MHGFDAPVSQVYLVLRIVEQNVRDALIICNAEFCVLVRIGNYILQRLNDEYVCDDI